MGRRRSSPSSSIESSCKSNPFGGSSSNNTRNLSTDLRLGLSFGSSSGQYYNGGENHEYEVVAAADHEMIMEEEQEEDQNECNSLGSFYVKVNMEGVPIGRKIDLYSLSGYHDLITTLDYMFNASILCKNLSLHVDHNPLYSFCLERFVNDITKSI